MRSSSSPKQIDFKQLDQELERAKIVEPQDIPKEMITMNSVVRIKELESGEETVYTLVFLSDASIEAGRISILFAIGTALIGYSVGDIIEWQVPSGLKRLQILEIHISQKNPVIMTVSNVQAHLAMTRGTVLRSFLA